MAEAQQRLHEALERATALLNCPAALMTLARLTAVNAVKRQFQAQGIKLAQIERRTIVASAREYLEEHPELIEDAAQTVRKSPRLRTLAEREARQRGRNQA